MTAKAILDTNSADDSQPSTCSTQGLGEEYFIAERSRGDGI